MKSFALKGTVVALASLLGSAAFASVNLDTGTTTGTFAKELTYPKAAPITGSTVVTTQLGFGVSAGQDRYIRMDLTGAKFAVAADGTDVVNAVPFANAVVVQGGAIDDTFVIYQVTADAAGNAASDVNTITLPDIYVTNGNAASVGVKYQLFEFAGDASNNNSANALYSAMGDLLKFGTGLGWTLTPNTTTASAEASFTEFTTTGSTPGVSATLARIGLITYAAKAGVVVADGTTAVTLGDLVAAGTKIVVTGDFGAAEDENDVYLDDDDNCTTVNAADSLDDDKTTAEFEIDTNAVTANVCYAVDGETTLPAQEIEAALDVVAAANATTADIAPSLLGEIDRDGTELQAPWFTGFTGYISRFVLTSTHSSDAGYTAKVLTEDGNTCTTGPGVSGTVPAGEQLVIDASTVCTSFSGATRGAVIFTIAAPNNKIQGVYQITEPNAGASTAYPMLRPGTN